MSMDRLQEKIRRTKNPSVIDMTIDDSMLPGCITSQTATWAEAYLQYTGELMEALRGQVPALRFSFNRFALRGGEGIATLQKVLKRAQKMSYYVFLDAPEALCAEAAAQSAQLLLSEELGLAFDGVILPSYMGSDGMKPYAKLLTKAGKSLFVVIRTGNKSAPELQDLLTGSRLVYMAMADVVNNLQSGATGRSGFAQIGCAAAATSADSLKNLRSKYKNMFLFVDGYDSPSANAKICGNAFDSYGHGAIVCAGTSVTAAWREPDCCEEDYVLLAQEAVARMKKNLSKYVSVL